MNKSSWFSALSLVLLAAGLTVAACPSSVCEDGEQRCVDGNDAVVETCENGAWVESDCDTGQNCMTMGNGTEHCMGGM